MRRGHHGLTSGATMAHIHGPADTTTSAGVLVGLATPSGTSGTISGSAEDSRGCLLERTWRGQHPVALPDGTQRKFLQDGDEVVMRAAAIAPNGLRIGFGSCRGQVLPVT